MRLNDPPKFSIYESSTIHWQALKQDSWILHMILILTTHRTGVLWKQGDLTEKADEHMKWSQQTLIDEHNFME